MMIRRWGVLALLLVLQAATQCVQGCYDGCKDDLAILEEQMRTAEGLAPASLRPQERVTDTEVYVAGMMLDPPETTQKPKTAAGLLQRGAAQHLQLQGATATAQLFTGARQAWKAVIKAQLTWRVRAPARGAGAGPRPVTLAAVPQAVDTAAALRRARNAQEDFCRSSRRYELLPASQQRPDDPSRMTVTKRGLHMYVHKMEDSISYIIYNTNDWDTVRTNQVLGALQESRDYMPTRPGSSPGSSEKPRSLLVDAGAGIGWYSLHAALAGHRVLALEASPINTAPLRRSICANPVMASRILLMGVVAATDSRTCLIFSSPADQNVALTCDPNPQLKAGNPIRAVVKVQALDTLLPSPATVHVLRLAVAGAHRMALDGARQLLTEGRVWHVLIEGFFQQMWADWPVGTPPNWTDLELLIAAGYECSSESFEGPFLMPSNAYQYVTSARDLMCRLRRFKRSIETSDGLRQGSI